MEHSRRTSKLWLPLRFLGAVSLFLTLAFPVFWFVHLEKGIYQLGLLLAVSLLDLILVWWLSRKTWGRLLMALASILCIGCGILVLLFAQFRHWTGQYRGASLETDFFTGKSVMVIVPHQDDDINLMQGVIEQYTDQGSRVSLVFSTNGDRLGQADIRFAEALNVAAAMGIPREDVYFLGFGDSWQPMEFDGRTVEHIYNSPQADALWTSYLGRQETYGTAQKDCYLPMPYTRANFAESIRALITQVQPDVIYASDYDSHIDHRALTLLVEEAIGQVLRENPGYQPQVFKGFCYRTAWCAMADFGDSLNILSSQDFSVGNSQEVEMPCYPWADRVRIPVRSSGLNRFMTQTDGYRFLSGYASQDAQSMTSRVVNGDKVFWKRLTGSLLYSAEIQIDGTPTRLLNDFKLVDSPNIASNQLDAGIQVITGPISVTLPQESELEALVLYDDPSGENQIMGGWLLLDNGTKIPFGPLNDNGTPTILPIPRQSVRSFTLEVTDSRGAPGLTELEAYAQDPTSIPQKPELVMLADMDGNFAYDYFLDGPGDQQTFTLYTYPHNPELEDEDFQITMTGSKRCSYTLQDGRLTISCPELASCKITIQLGDVRNTTAFSNPGPLKTWILKTMQAADYDLVHCEQPLGISAQISYYQSLLEKILSILP